MELVVNGLKIFYKAKKGGNKDDIPLLFLHGAGCTSYTWYNQIKADIPGYTQIAMDLPGHGRSDGEGAESIEKYCDFIEQFLDVLNIDNVAIAGHSMGGAIAQLFALKYKEKLDSLILIGTGAKLRTSQALLEMVKRGESLAEYSYSYKTSGTLIKNAEKEFLLTTPMTRYKDFMACDGFNLIDKIKDIETRALILCGEDDIATPIKYSDYLRNNIMNTQLHIIPEAGHMVMWEKPEVVNKHIVDFLSNA